MRLALTVIGAVGYDNHETREKHEKQIRAKKFNIRVQSSRDSHPYQSVSR